MNLRRYAGAVVAVAAATAATFLIYDLVAPSTSLLFFPAVILPAIFGGYGPAALATVLSAASLAYFFIPPRFIVNIGVDDLIRLMAFAAVSFSSAWLSSARHRAEDAERHSVDELRAALETLRRVSDWPPFGGANLDASIRQVMGHAAGVLGAERAVVVWETDDEPWRYVAGSKSAGITRLSPDTVGRVIAQPLEGTTFVTPDARETARLIVSRGGVVSEWHGEAAGDVLSPDDLSGAVASAPFHGEHVTGRLFLVGIPDPDVRALTAADVIAHEVANSLEQLYFAARMRDLAVREDRLRVSRDLHDGVLQALTGIRLDIQTIASELDEETAVQSRLLAIERSLATEQRELRLFIDELKPVAVPGTEPASIHARLDDMCARLAAEWRVPISVRVLPPALSLPQDLDHALRLMIHEAVVNALKHGEPSRVTVAVVQRPGDIHVAISDDGTGFHMLGTFDHDNLMKLNLGPVSLRERVAALKGRLQIESKSSGSRVEFSIPLSTGETTA